MQYLNTASLFLILSSSLTLTTTAAPTSSSSPLLSNLIPKTCPIAYPSSLGFPINYNISQGPNGSSKQDALVSFTIPPNSWGCTLHSNFPANYPITSSGASQVYFFNSEGSQVGTITFASPQNTVINSFACDEVMAFRMSIGSMDQAGAVTFADTINAGLTMTYNC